MLFLLQALNKQESLNEAQGDSVVGKALRSLHRPMLACLSPRNVTPILRHRVLRFALGSLQSFSLLSHPASKGKSGQTEWKLWQGRGKQSTRSLQTLARKRTSHPRTCRTQACLGHSSTQLTFLFFQLLREATRPRMDQFLTQSASWQAPPILQQVQFW